MRLPRPLHSWNVSVEEARKLQVRLSAGLQLGPLPRDIELVAGADMALSRERGLFFAAVAVLSFPGLQVVEVAGACVKATFPYIPGLLSFREGPAILAAFEKLRERPHAVIFDGQGTAHPRGFGLAAHMGLWLGIPSVGCAKSRLIGDYEEPGRRRGDRRLLEHAGKSIGLVLRTRPNVKPVFVSPGYRCDIEGAAELTLMCCRGFRLPETTRIAHREVAEMKRRFVDKAV